MFKKGSKYTRRDVGRIVLPDLTFREDTLIDTLVSNKNERIDDFEAGLERHGDGGAVHNGRGRAFDGQAPAYGH